MILSFEAENICGHSSDFVLLGMEPAIEPEKSTVHEHEDGSRYKVVPLLGGDETVKHWHTAVTIKLEGVYHGQIVAQQVELGYDPRKLRWVTPTELRGRFFLRFLRWGDHELMKRPGVV